MPFAMVSPSPEPLYGADLARQWRSKMCGTHPGPFGAKLTRVRKSAAKNCANRIPE
jgi:hypothetical protein